MTLQKTYPDGDEIWYCPLCQRRMVVNWLQNPIKLDIIEQGNATASHCGSKGGLQVWTPQVTNHVLESENLELWLDTLNGLDLDGLQE